MLEYSGATGAIQRWYAYGPGANVVVNQTNVVAGTRAALIPDIQGSVIASLDSRYAIGSIFSNQQSPEIDPRDIIGKTPAEIDQLARDRGLIPKGPDPMNGQGPGGATAARLAGYDQAPGLLNGTTARFGWSYNAGTQSEVLSARIGSTHFDIPGTSIIPGGNPVRDALVSGTLAGGTLGGSTPVQGASGANSMAGPVNPDSLNQSGEAATPGLPPGGTETFQSPSSAPTGPGK